ncbi:hypothetical protein [Acetobacterium wieringae]|uniref:hypothetical protein n=1 Tax=Acetobacterium wieringae TaxID=52694 RepID=UPI003BA24120
MTEAFQQKVAENFELNLELKTISSNLSKKENYLLNAEYIFVDTCWLMELSEKTYEQLKLYRGSKIVILQEIIVELDKLINHHSFKTAKAAQTGKSFVNRGLKEGLFILTTGEGRYADDQLVNIISKTKGKVALLTLDKQLIARVTSQSTKSMTISVCEI